MVKIQTKDLAYAYDQNQKLHFDDIDSEGLEPLLIIGGSGSGKTTLLHLLGGLMKPNQGSIRIGDEEISTMSSGQVDQFRGKQIGIIFQQNHFVAALNVLENLTLAQKLGGQAVDEATCKNYLRNLNIEDKALKYTDELSQGERQRVAIARALVNKPKIILADEPTSALDDRNCEEVIKLLEKQAKEKQAKLIIVTHDSRLKSRYPDQIVLT